MRNELDEKLVKAFPNLYSDRDADMMATCMCWGFNVGDGLFDLIWDLSSKLEPLIVKYKAEHPDEECYPRALQVKEKFGGLRFYMTSATDEMWDLISEAEHKSYRICEVCGKKGRVRNRGWLKALCNKHAIEKGFLPKEFWKRQVFYITSTLRNYKFRIVREYYEMVYKISKLFRKRS